MIVALQKPYNPICYIYIYIIMKPAKLHDGLHSISSQIRKDTVSILSNQTGSISFCLQGRCQTALFLPIKTTGLAPNFRHPTCFLQISPIQPNRRFRQWSCLEISLRSDSSYCKCFFDWRYVYETLANKICSTFSILSFLFRKHNPAPFCLPHPPCLGFGLCKSL